MAKRCRTCRDWLWRFRMRSDAAEVGIVYLR